ncbi:MAG: hypothetical protein HFJ44_04000 [Clostridia bacterium]|jgi:hypothetical protein|nr:hypothetical protein [Clostridia bacterium]
MDKSIIGLKISKLMNSDFILNQYAKIAEGKPEVDKEKYFAKLFNLSLIFFQICPDEEKCKKFINTYMYADSSNSEYPDIEIMGLLLEADTELTEEEMAEALKHGVAVHFTTPKIAEKIKSDGKMSTLFSDEDRELLYKGISQTDPNSKYVFTTGFGMKKGICAGSITTGFYMFHTPETLSFIYGGNFLTGDREKAMEHLYKSTENMNPETRDALRKKLERLWDSTASKSKRTAVLIDRDKLEYKKNNYYGKNGEISRVEEVRPYMRGDLYDLHNIEMNLIEEEVPTSSLFFVDVPTIAELDRRVEEKKKEKDNQIK